MLEMRMIFWVTVAITVLGGAASGVLTVSCDPFEQSLLVYHRWAVSPFPFVDAG